MSDDLTLEERATNYETMQHIARVQQHLTAFVQEILSRAMQHDQSKLRRPEVEAFTKHTAALAETTYGSPEYLAAKAAMAPAIAHHYANNRHHPEFFRKNEEWRWVVGFDGHYEVSDFGDVRSVDREVERSGPTGSLRKNGKLLAQEMTPKGYCRVQLQAGSKRKNAMVHQLVAQAFIPNPENKPQVNHKNGREKWNNSVGNLEWSTSSENQIHAYETGLKRPGIKYVVSCEQLDIMTFGCLPMERKLRALGYEKASAASIWACINNGGKHLDLEFIGSPFEEWMNSPMSSMTLVDIIELFCDWKAASERHNDGNLRSSIEINADRFSMSPQLVRIFENTVDLLEPS